MFKLNIFVMILISLLLTGFVIAQDEENEMEAGQKAWMEYMTPGSMHEMMAESVGEWKTKSTFWMTPSAEPMVMEGTATYEMILGGRYLKTDHTGTMMGMPFEGINLQGFDNATEKFTSVWFDNLGTGISVSAGIYDADKNSLFFTGSMVDPISGKDIEYKQIVKFIDDNHQVFEMYTEFEGKEYKSMEVEATR
jgi:hypothetical protein